MTRGEEAKFGPASGHTAAMPPAGIRDKSMTIAFDNSYAHLGAPFSVDQPPEPVREPGLLRINVPLAEELGLDPTWLESTGGISALAGNTLPEGATPIAAAYAGHQFGQFNPQLGDGRAVLLGEVIDRHGRRRDIQLKGSGRTPWSRGGDGRSPLGPVIREYLVSEAMHALGVPTTRALAAVTTGEPVYRNGAEPGAVLTRVAASHIRIGSFEFFAARQEHEALSRLASYTLERHYPQHQGAENPALALLTEVVHALASLIAHWQLLGFVHGVMNTDNMLLSGETVDYGPCAFMEQYDPATVFSSIDHQGRYAYANQPGIAQWNLARLAEALLPLIDEDTDRAVELAKTALAEFPEHYETAYRDGLARKIGLPRMNGDGDAQLADDLLAALQTDAADFTLAFCFLTANVGETAAIGASADGDGDEGAEAADALFKPGTALLEWLPRWKQRLQQAPDVGTVQAMMRAANPLFIPRNHLVQRAITLAEGGDYAFFHRLVERLTDPFSWDAADRELALPATPDERVHQTFCGT